MPRDIPRMPTAPLPRDLVTISEYSVLNAYTLVVVLAVLTTC